MASFSMAAQSANSSNIPSSSSALPWPYDVFLSFRGEDTRHNFVGHLYKELVQRGLNTFKDDEELQRGKEISPELVKAIKDSRFPVVVLSKNYAESRWCLDELVEILECKKNVMEQTVFPVFYHVAPSEVRSQIGKFGRGFDGLLSKNEVPLEKIQTFKDALAKIGNFSGWVLGKDRSETEFIEDLVGYIFEKSNHLHFSVAKDLVGMDSRMNNVIELLALGNDDVRVVGMYGTDGVGKTTIARAVYDKISCQFPSRSFIANVRAVFEKSGIQHLQEQLIRDTLRPKDLRAGDIGESMIRTRVCRKRVLIVLDDVDELTVLEKLVVVGDLVCSGSRMIITSRRKQLIDMYGATHAYKVEELNRFESVELFKLKAFGKHQHIGINEKLVSHAVEYCKGVPLALRILGSALCGQNEDQWRSALSRLEECPLPEVRASCLYSYDELDRKQKQIFLDIACFFHGSNKKKVTNILESCGFEPDIGTQVLVDKSLVSISSYNELWMHDLIRELGELIVFEESHKTPGERSRLFRYEDVYHVLEENTGTEAVESIAYDYPEKKCLKLRADVFAKMKRLRLLKISGVHLPEGLNYLPNELRYLDWTGCPLRCFPQKFQPEHLVEFRIPRSCIEQLWEGPMALPKLRIMDVSYSANLTKSPDFSGVPNLEQLNYRFCRSLVDVHQSIGALNKLIWLDLSYCEKLTNLPNSMKMESLESLHVSGCAKLTNIPETIGNLRCLQELHLDGTDITELPDSVGDLSNLAFLNLDCCQNLRSLPDSICQAKALRSLVVTGCSKLGEMPENLGHVQCLGSIILPQDSDISLGPLLPLPSAADLIPAKSSPVISDVEDEKDNPPLISKEKKASAIVPAQVVNTLRPRSSPGKGSKIGGWKGNKKQFFSLCLTRTLLRKLQKRSRHSHLFHQ